jgi:putative flippase GtrA
MDVSTAEALLARARSPQGVKAIRYTLTSVISVVISQVLLGITFGLLEWSARSANVFAVCVSAVPSYMLNRRWAWGKRGRSHLLKEVVPFWSLALLGLGFSTWAAGWAEGAFDRNTLAVLGASLGAFGVLWVGKFIIFNELIFKHHPEVLHDAPALDGHTGIPT